jgi:hypothetical protein
MKQHLFFVFIVMTMTACITQIDSHEVKDGFPNGAYCAQVSCFDQNSGIDSAYALEVEITDNKLTTIKWPNGGRLDSSHFKSTDISNGFASFTSKRGYNYTVRITSGGGSCNTGNYISPEEM